MRPDGFVRGLVRTVSELARERLQARRQVRQDMRPRVHRGWGFAGERGALNGVLRDFNTIMVGEALAAGARSVYVDYVDYDAVAHHAGIMRPESLDALVGLDAVLGRLEQVAEAAPRDYRIVVFSDHGQSQGEVFADRYGQSLPDLVSRLAGTAVAGTEVNTEGSAQVGALTGDQPALVAQALRAGSSGRAEQAEAEEAQAQAAMASEQSLLVFGSGNLGLVYAGGESHRLTRDEIERRWPALLPGLIGHEGVSFVVVETDDGPVAIGPSGEHRLRDGVVVGNRPVDAVPPGGGRVPPARVVDARGPGHRGQQPARRVDRRGGGLRGPRRVPRWPRRLAGPRDDRLAQRSAGPARATHRRGCRAPPTRGVAGAPGSAHGPARGSTAGLRGHTSGRAASRRFWLIT